MPVQLDRNLWRHISTFATTSDVHRAASVSKSFQDMANDSQRDNHTCVWNNPGLEGEIYLPPSSNGSCDAEHRIVSDHQRCCVIHIGTTKKEWAAFLHQTKHFSEAQAIRIVKKCETSQDVGLVYHLRKKFALDDFLIHQYILPVLNTLRHDIIYMIAFRHDVRDIPIAVCVANTIGSDLMLGFLSRSESILSHKESIQDIHNYILPVHERFTQKFGPTMLMDLMQIGVPVKDIGEHTFKVLTKLGKEVSFDIFKRQPQNVKIEMAIPVLETISPQKVMEYLSLGVSMDRIYGFILPNIDILDEKQLREALGDPRFDIIKIGSSRADIEAILHIVDFDIFAQLLVHTLETTEEIAKYIEHIWGTLSLDHILILLDKWMDFSDIADIAMRIRTKRISNENFLHFIIPTEFYGYMRECFNQLGEERVFDLLEQGLTSDDIWRSISDAGRIKTLKRKHQKYGETEGR